MNLFSKAAWLPTLAWASLFAIDARAAEPTPPAVAPIAARQDPADPRAAVPPLVYRSSFGDYRSFSEPEVAPWRATNDIVRQRGGWRAYAREARVPEAPREAGEVQAPDTAASQPGSAPTRDPMPAMPGHKLK